MNKWPLSENPTITWERKNRLTNNPIYYLVTLFYCYLLAYLKKLLNMILFLWHPLLGVGVVLIGSVNIVYGVLWFTGYMAYQIIEFIKRKDEADIDVRDFLIGLGFAFAYLYIKWLGG